MKSALQETKKITSTELAMLKHFGELFDAKVTLCNGSCFREKDDLVCVHIHKKEFTSFTAARLYLIEVSKNIARPKDETELEVL